MFCVAAIQAQEKPTLYLETTVVSYLAARPSSDVVTLTHQEMTRQWWEKRRKLYAIFVSEVVHIEANRGDAEAARRRIQIIKEFPVLRATDDARELAKHYMSMIPLPRCAEADALHLAIAVINRMDYPSNLELPASGGGPGTACRRTDQPRPQTVVVHDLHAGGVAV